MDEKYHQVIRRISAYYGIPVELIYGKNNNADISKIRHLIVYALRKHFDLTQEYIGELIGKDHSAVINSLKKFNKLTYPDLWDEMDYIKQIIIDVQIPSNNWIYSQIRNPKRIEFKYCENQDVCGLYSLSISK